MDKVGIAIVGCGYWGVNYIRVFNELPQSHVVAICEKHPNRLKEVQSRFPGLEVTLSVRDLLQRDRFQAVVVCTQATAHYEVAQCCLAAVKHVLVEKPITTAVADAEKLMALADSKHVTLMVGHTFIYNAGVQKVKACLERAEVGKIYYLYARRTNLGPIRNDVNALWDLGSHDVAIFNYLLGNTPKWVSAVGGRVLGNHHADVGFITLGYPNDIIGHIHVSWVDPNKVRELVVVGSDKRILFDDLSVLEQVRIFERGVTPVPVEPSSYGEHQFFMRDGDIISPKIKASEPLKNQCSHFISCILQGESPISGGQEGLDVVRVMEAVDRSINCNGTPVGIIQGGSQWIPAIE